MKNMAIIVMMLGGASIAGYMYMRKHPEMICNMKNMAKDTSRKVYNMLDED